MNKMKKRLLINSIKSERFVAAATCLFMAASAMLLSLSIILFAGLMGSVDRLMETAGTPDFLQMHAGDISAEDISEFAGGRNDVEEMQIAGFLNLQNSDISLGEKSLSENTQDNGLCTQSDKFDLLLDAEGNVIFPSEGEIYIPVCYREEYKVETGDTMHIGSESLTIAGFLRDSQMNSMMASSKRFLVSKQDYERLRPHGSEEYLIEFKLREGSDLNAFATAYHEAQLPENGPTITFPLIRMMNALSDGIMILVILLVSAVTLFISVLCIRTLIMTQLEKDKREIGIMKAVGISGGGICSMYFSKYLLLSAAGSFIGLGAAMIISGPLGARMRELYGNPGNMAMIITGAILGGAAAEGIILLSVLRTLHRMDRLSAVEALYGRGAFGREKSLLLPVSVITAAAVFIILVPFNMNSTIASPGFATYMGIGESQIRIDIRQNANTKENVDAVTGTLEKDERVSDFVLMQTSAYGVMLSDGTTYDLMIETGDHGRYPVKYTEGRYPEKENEVALSILNAREMNIKLGDELQIIRNGDSAGAETITCKVCGIYSDITNGGKSAKACFSKSESTGSVMWSIIYLSLKDGYSPGDWVREYKESGFVAGSDRISDGLRITLIEDYLQGTYGQTIRKISSASVICGTLACLILFTVILLMTRLMIWKERGESSLMKALGFTAGDLKKRYVKRNLAAVAIGLFFGIFAGIVPGETLAGLLLGTMGAYGFHFILKPAFIFTVVPLVILITALTALFISLREVDGIRAYECLGE